MWFWVIYFVLSIFVGAYARKIKRGEVAWFFMSLLLSPLIAFVILVAAGPPKESLKKCPKCAEEVKAEALVCRFCGFDFSKPTVSHPESIPPVKKANSEIRDLAANYINKMISKK